jgi:hypothetical protein
MKHNACARGFYITIFFYHPMPSEVSPLDNDLQRARVLEDLLNDRHHVLHVLTHLIFAQPFSQ